MSIARARFPSWKVENDAFFCQMARGTSALVIKDYISTLFNVAAMTRKRALGRQQRDRHSTHNAHHELEHEPTPSSSASWYGDFGRKSSPYRYSFLPKSNQINKKLRPLRLMQFIIILKILLLLSVTFTVFLTLPKLVFDAVRYSMMNRPSILYGSPTDWKDVVGCLSRNHRHELRDYFRSGEDTELNYANIPLNSDAVWNWSRYSSSHSTNKTEVAVASIPQRRLLIAQYSGKGSYQKLMKETEPINRAYAKRWGHDYTTLVGTALKFPGLMYEISQNYSQRDNSESGKNHQDCRYYNKSEDMDIMPSISSSSTQWSSTKSSFNYESQSTFNKIPLLFKAMEESPLKYDQVLILDTDAMIVDLEYDITSLLLSSNSADRDYDNTNEKIKEKQEASKIKQGGKNSPFNHGVYFAPGQNDDAHRRYRNREEVTTTNHDVDYEYFLVAYRVWKLDWLSTWDVNAGITLWNLRHPKTRLVAEDWLKLSLSDPKQILLKSDDQYYLQRSLQKVIANSGNKKKSLTGAFGMRSFRNWWNRHSLLPALLNYCRDIIAGERGTTQFFGSSDSGRCDTHDDCKIGIRTVRDEFEYYDATVIKHFKRDTASWSRTGLEQRLLRIREAKVEICRMWPEDCIP